MRKYEKQERTTTHDILVKIACDLCGKEAKTANWDAGYYTIDETEISVTIKQKEGDTCPDGGSGEKYVVDMCPDCFKKRLIPWLESEGARIAHQSWEW